MDSMRVRIPHDHYSVHSNAGLAGFKEYTEFLSDPSHPHPIVGPIVGSNFGDIA